MGFGTASADVWALPRLPLLGFLLLTGAGTGLALFFRRNRARAAARRHGKPFYVPAHRRG